MSLVKLKENETMQSTQFPNSYIRADNMKTFLLLWLVWHPTDNKALQTAAIVSQQL